VSWVNDERMLLMLARGVECCCVESDGSDGSGVETSEGGFAVDLELFGPKFGIKSTLWVHRGGCRKGDLLLKWALVSECGGGGN